MFSCVFYRSVRYITEFGLWTLNKSYRGTERVGCELGSGQDLLR